MKRILLIIAMLCVYVFSNAQSVTITINWNPIYEYYEIHTTNSYVGYIKENSIFNRLDFYDTNGKQYLYEKEDPIFHRYVRYNMNNQQVSYRTWNDIYKRYDCYEFPKKLIGWFKYNQIFKRWEYFEL